METAYLGLGSSLGDRFHNLKQAIEQLEEAGPGVRVMAVSSLYESPHMGLQPEDADRFPKHYNCVIQIETVLNPLQLLERIQAVETEGGRKRNEKWAPRTIDIDILLFGNQTCASETLTLPHAGLAGRAFALLPLSELAPDLELPDGSTIIDLATRERIRSQRIEKVSDNGIFIRSIGSGR